MAARGHLVKWLRGRFLLKRVDSGSTFGSHSHYADQCVAAALLTHGVTVDACVAYSAIAEHVRRTTECGRTSLCLSMPHGLLTRVPKDVACRLHLAGSSLRFSRAPWLGFGGTRFRTRDPLKRNVPPNHFTKWPRAFLLKRVDFGFDRPGCRPIRRPMRCRGAHPG